MSIQSRKNDHLEICSTKDVGFRRSGTLFDNVRLVHDACPELAVDEIDTAVTVFGKRLRAPLFIAAMTGGTPEAAKVNRDLASIAEARGYGFGLGSQRAMLKRPEHADSYRVRDVAPTAVVLGNIGAVQARELGHEVVAQLAEEVGADAMCVHLNPAMELIQRDGDRDFRNVVDTIGELTARLRVPVVAKETGSGLSQGVGHRLYNRGVRHVDVSGAGGTSWVGVETMRAARDKHASGATLGESLWDWGIPTAASIAEVGGIGFATIIATGGVTGGLEVAKAIALGAHAAGVARSVLVAYHQGGREGAERVLEAIEHELRAVMLLTGSGSVAALRRCRRVVTGDLRAWLGDPA